MKLIGRVGSPSTHANRANHLHRCNASVNVRLMTNADEWNDFLDRLPGAPNDFTIANSAGVSASTVSRWRAGTSRPRPSQAVDVARSFGLLSVHGLLASGHLTPDELNEMSENFTLPKSYALEEFSNAELATELAKRLNRDLG